MPYPNLPPSGGVVQGVTKERNRRLVTQHKDTAQLAQQIHHVLKFCHWAINTGSSTALLYSKRLVWKSALGISAAPNPYLQ